MYDDNSFEQYLTSRYSKFLRYASALGNFSIGKDLVHDAFTYFWANRSKYLEHENLEAIIFQKIKGLSIDRARNKSSTKFELTDEEHMRNTLYQNENDYEKIDRLIDAQKAFKKLGEKCREIIELSFDYSYKEIAKLLDMNSLTVGSRLTKCYTELRGMVNDKV